MPMTDALIDASTDADNNYIVIICLLFDVSYSFSDSQKVQWQ